MKISVVIPTHRRPELLQEAMVSVAQQSMLPDELIVVDDADDSLTRQNVLNFALNWQVPTRYVPNVVARGACGSRNLGAFVSAHEWIAFLDDDDLWQPAFLARTAERAREGDVDLVMSALNRQEQGRSDIMRSTPEGMSGANVLQFRSAMTGSNFLIKGTHFAAVRGFDPAMTVFNDWDLLVRLLRNHTKYFVIAEPLVDWRDHSGDRIATPSLKRADGIDKFLARYGRELPPAMRRELRTTALGIRRKCAVRPHRYIELTIALAFAHGPVAALARFMKTPKLFATS
jgi:glycosyltransferase involved in cell wall biosynthesis